MSGHDAWLHAPGPRHYQEVRCSKCGWSWEVLGHEEYGIWLPERDDELTCEECGAEGEA
jgi:DNA-directed RNA polymerase subunit RPC12/RpoP